MTLPFHPIQLDRQTAYLENLAKCPQIASDYSFINIWSWAEEYGLQWAWGDRIIWIKQTFPFENLWAPVGDWHNIDWDCEQNTNLLLTHRFIRVPERLLQIWKTHCRKPLEAVETRNHWDYLYNREELVTLTGNRFHKKKNLVNQFRKNYEFAYLPFGRAMVKEAKEMQADWCTWRDCENNDTLAAENKAIANVLNYWQQLSGVTGSALRVNNTLAAYTIAEAMPDNTLIIHFEKGDPQFKGCYQAINQMFLEHDDSQSTIVNREQDLGDEGLRKAKLSYHPIDFVRKYQVSFFQ